MKKQFSFLLLLVLMPIWLNAQKLCVLPLSGDDSSYPISTIAKHTFVDGMFVTTFNDGRADALFLQKDIDKLYFVEDTLSSLLFATEAISDGVVLYPMPVSENLHISFESLVAGVLHLDIFTTNGLSVCKREHTLEIGSNDISVSLSDLVSGFYFCRLQTDDFDLIKKIIKE